MQQNLFHHANLLPFDGEAYLHENVFDAQECKFYLAQLMEEIDWKQEPIKIFGKAVMQPRLTAWCSNNNRCYSYSGITMQAQAFSKSLMLIKQKVDSLSEVPFSNALLNWYRDGNDSMGWHRDNEKELGENPMIASVSFGASRKFEFRNYANKNLKQTLILPSGSVLIMKGNTQQYWEHQLPKSSQVLLPRINITFRLMDV